MMMSMTMTYLNGWMHSRDVMQLECWIGPTPQNMT